MAPTVDPTEQSALLPKPPYSHKSSPHGYFHIFVGSLTYPIVALLVRYALTELSFSPLPSLLLRSIISLTLSTPLLLFLQPCSLSLSPRQFLFLAASGVLGAAHFLCMYAALLHVPLATVVTFNSVSTPLTAFICAILLGEGVRNAEVLALAASTVGVVLIAHPHNDSTTTTLGIVLATMSAILAALWCSALRAMGDVHALVRVLCLSLCIGIETSFFARASDWSAIIQKPLATAIVSAASALSFATMMAFNAGMKRCRAGPGLLVMTMSIPFSFALGWLFLGESAGWFTLVGAALVIGSAGVVALQPNLDETH